MQVEVHVQVQVEVQGEALPPPPILPISLKAGLIGIYIYIGGWGFVLPGNSFGSCASVIPRLGYFQRFVLRGGVPFLLPNARRKATNKSSPQGLAISAK